MQGLQFRKLDLHLHTPASKDFHGVVSPEDIITEAKSKNLDGIAVTDHNTAEWIDRVKEAAHGTSVTVFPGVEITCAGGQGGIHIIALFDPSVSGDHVKGLLSALGMPPDSQGKPESIVTEKTIQQVIDTIQSPQWAGLAIPAHVNSNKGILREMRGQQRIQIIRHSSLLAVEATDFQKAEKGKRAVDWLNGSDPEYQRKLAVYQASDNPNPNGDGHVIEGIGTRCSYFKLEKVNLEGLRQCFCDPDVRIRQDYEHHTQAFPYVKRIKVSSGFLDGQEVEFHTGLNSILGAKGTGKSLLVELLRFALGQPPKHPDISKDHVSKLNIKLKEFGFVEVWLVDETGKEVYVKRTYNSAIDSPFEVSFDPSQLFPMLFLSQNEIIKIAESEQEQLAFIDNFLGFHTHRARIAELEADLEKLDKQMAEGTRAFSEYENLEIQLKTIEAEITRLDESLKSSIFQKYSQARQKFEAFNEQSRYLQSLRNSVTTLISRSNRGEMPVLAPDLKRDPALKRNAAAIEQAQEAIDNQLKELERLLASSQQKIEHELGLWNTDFTRIRQEYEHLVQERGGDYQALAAQREQKIKRRDDLTRRISALQRKKEGTAEISKKREELLDELERIYTDYTQQRQAKCDKFQAASGGKLLIKIIESSNTEEFKRRLLALKQGSYIKEHEIEAISQKVRPRDFIIAMLRFNTALAAKHPDTGKYLQEVADKAQIPLSRMMKLAEFLMGAIENTEQLLALQYKAHPQDRPEIKFNVGDNLYEPLDAISIGQKSTALLIIALSDGSMPVVIDQPEDSLDIRSIWDDICSKLRDHKERRQFIFTTHNGSVAVASDSDYFIIMDGNSKSGRVAYSGSMDHNPVAEEVLKYLEGGVPTYRRKYLKYRGDDHMKS